MSPQVGRYYTNKKNKKLYKVTDIGMHSETLERYVVYRAMYHNPKSYVWVRPYDLFAEKFEEA